MFVEGSSKGERKYSAIGSFQSLDKSEPYVIVYIYLCTGCADHLITASSSSSSSSSVEIFRVA